MYFIHAPPVFSILARGRAADELVLAHGALGAAGLAHAVRGGAALLRLELAGGALGAAGLARAVLALLRAGVVVRDAGAHEASVARLGLRELSERATRKPVSVLGFMG